MTPGKAAVRRIAVRRIRQAGRESALFLLTLGSSVLAIACLGALALQAATAKSPAYEDLPFQGFLVQFSACLRATALILAAVTAVMLLGHSRRRADGNAHTLAVLTGIGATAAQRRRLLWVEAGTLYLPVLLVATPLGVALGTLMGRRFLQAGPLSLMEWLGILLLTLGVLLGGGAVIALGVAVASLGRRRRPVIRVIRRQNAAAAQENHSYRNSKTFRARHILARLAHKNVDFHAAAYRRIALALSLAGLYPVLLIRAILTLGEVEVVVDTNPYDGIDTAAAVMEAVDRLAVALAVALLLLTALALGQAVSLLRLLLAERRRTAQVYLTVGLTEGERRRMLRMELARVLPWTLIGWLLLGVVAVTAFGLLTAA